MYQDFFRLTESPFAIVPNPKFYFLSERHKEALSHVLSGIEDGGGLALLTGEVGTGKTTTMKALRERLPTRSQVATILNPSLSVLELMQTLCDELCISYQPEDGFKVLNDAISERLYFNDVGGIQTVLLVDEAQHLMPDVLEQLRLLTNIETANRKLLKVILIGQPELQQLLRQPQLRQLAQRITGRYHLMPLVTEEVRQYILHRLSCAGRLDKLFDDGAIKVIARETGGVPRLINLVCDQSLKLAYRASKQTVSSKIATQACKEALEWQDMAKPQASGGRYWPYYVGAIGGAALLAVAIRVGLNDKEPELIAPVPTSQPQTVVEVVAQPPQTAVVAEAAAVQPSAINVVTPQAPETLSFASLVNQSLSAGTAMQSLYKLWGFDADVLAASCSTEVRGDLACYKSKLPYDQLVTINRPAVLAMNGPEGKNWFTLMTGKGNGQVELLSGDQRVLVSDAFLKQHWSGEALILWRPPLGNSGAIKSGQRGERVRWLDQRLNLVLGSTDPVSNRFGSSQRSKVREFQRANGLDADGIPGPLTFMVLDTVLEMPGPSLSASIDATLAETALIREDNIVALPKRDLFTLALKPLPPIALKDVIAEVPPAPSEPEVVTISSGDIEGTEQAQARPVDTSELTLENLDLSVLSPELAMKVESAMNADKSRALDAKLERAKSPSNVVAISDIPSDMLNRLPKLDFQTHIYASNEKSRWVKVNGVDTREGEFVADGVLLRGIEPQQVVVQFENALIAIPALTTW
ncbi:AAA family ATPase [Enterovibrio nigricans]|uniref:General secretion pathway protein A n=1 Tax=Enterovibrio nigricans DSM 22720 TaxID=1121868 RepID=A0A1T4UP56_9GAMM|nr:AAA family ATPase [Enterovibrio nigricans]PKF49385.1 general secretion pathway protein GspA [Enterovibrio nigricans]SKA54489.1 general secretion pathway protein A [Enterovibrio nigricans DSM 22720]